MVTPDEVKKLAALARVRVTEEELPKFTAEFDAILAYVSQLERVAVDAGGEEIPPLRNIMREDGEPHATGAYTGKIAEQFPARDGDALSVKQIISHD